jgi:hypothetical protein
MEGRRGSKRITKIHKKEGGGGKKIQRLYRKWRGRMEGRKRRKRVSSSVLESWQCGLRTVSPEKKIQSKILKSQGPGKITVQNSLCRGLLRLEACCASFSFKCLLFMFFFLYRNFENGGSPPVSKVSA